MRRLAASGVLFVSLLGVVLLPVNASAHVLIKSTDGTKAAILHTMPDDDPIAGEEATFMFDTQDGVLAENASIKLTIENKADGTVSEVKTSRDGSLVSSRYIFPAQGAYQVRYSIESGGVQLVFEQTMRVSRGIVDDALVKDTYEWAEALLFVSSALTLLLAIVSWNYRKEIFKSSVL